MKRHRKAGSFLLLAAVAVAIAALSPRPAALVDPAAAEEGRAEAVAVRGHVAAGFGRLVFDWQSPVDYAVHREPGGALAITFARPAEFALDPALRALAGYIRAAEVGQGGRRVLLRLAGDPRLDHFRSQDSVVIDFIGPPAEPPIRVRAGEHPGFSRIVFDWTTPVAYILSRNGEEILLRFQESRALDLAAVSADLPRRVRAIRAAAESGTVAVRITLRDGGFRLHDFRVGPKVVLDIRDPEGSAPAAVATPAPVGSAAPTAAAKPAPAQPTAPTAAVRPAPPEPAAPTAAAKPALGAPAMPAEAEPRRPAATGAPTPLTPPSPATQAPRDGTAAGREAQAPSAVRVPVRVAADGDGVTLRFAWAEAVPAAAFRRAGAVWLLFARPAQFDLQEVLAVDHPYLGDALQWRNEAATVLQLKSPPEAVPRLSRDGTHWLVDLRARPDAPEAALPQRIERGGAQAGVRLRLEAPMVGAAIPVKDPEVGDSLVVAPLLEPGLGVARGQEWPEFRLLPTLQGIAVVPRADDLVVRAEAGRVLIDRAGGLLASEEMRRLAVADGGATARAGAAAARAKETEPRLFDLPAWRRNGPSTFVMDRQALQRAVVEVPADRQAAARLDLARFFFAHGLAVEASGVLDLIRRESPERMDEPELLLLTGASALLRGDDAEAERYLASAALDGEPEAELWRAALAAGSAARTGAWDDVARAFQRHAGLIDDYPESVRFRLRLLAAEAMIEAGDPVAALAPLDAMRADSPDREQADQIAFLEARRAAVEGRLSRAIAIWERLTDSPHQPTQARARFALADTLLKEGLIARAEAIERLERVRFLWRGGPFEFAVLHRLGQLYLAEGKMRDGLTTLRQAVSRFPDDPRAGAATQEMAEAFRALYLEGGADRLSPLVAVALFDEFRELTPPGEEGDAMIAALADRLVAVDLLDRAAILLEDQVIHRLSGAEKARVGARLAAVRLLDRQPEAALKALAASAVPDLPEPLERQRRHLEARALFDSERGTEALALLEGDDSYDAALLRADMLWRLREWPGAAEALAVLLDKVEAGAGPEDARGEAQPSVARLVLNRAIALTLAGENARLAALADRYGALMAKDPLGDSFRLLTAGTDAFDTPRTIAERLAGAGDLANLMATYRQRLQTASRGEGG